MDTVEQVPVKSVSKQTLWDRWGTYILITVFVLLMLSLLSGAILYKRATQNSGKSTVNPNTAASESGKEKLEQREARYNNMGAAIRSKNTQFLNEVNNIVIDDALIKHIQEEPLYGTDGTPLGTGTPDLKGLELEKAKVKFKEYLNSISEQNVNESYVRKLNVSVSSYLWEVTYLARLSKSPYVSEANRKYWRAPVVTGKIIVENMSDFAIQEKAELKKFISDFFKASEFVELGIT